MVSNQSITNYWILPDKSIPVDVLIGHTWLNLPQVTFHKYGSNFIIEYATIGVESLRNLPTVPGKTVCNIETTPLTKMSGSVSVVIKPFSTSVPERWIIHGILEDWRKNILLIL